MQYFCLLIPILIGYFLDEMTVGVIFGSILWLFARELGKPRQEEHDAKLQNLEKEIELLKLRLTALEQETVHDKAEVGQARKLRAVLSEHADDIQTTLCRKLILQIQCCLPHNSFSHRYAFYTSFS